LPKTEADKKHAGPGVAGRALRQPLVADLFPMKLDFSLRLTFSARAVENCARMRRALFLLRCLGVKPTSQRRGDNKKTGGILLPPVMINLLIY